jgi:hypothetical protein
MASEDLIPSNRDRSELASNEVQFALVIARMIDLVNSSPEDMRQAVYDLARYKLQEQFTHSDAQHINQTQQALEAAIRGVEEFSKQGVSVPAIPPPQQLSDAQALSAPRRLPASELAPQARRRPRLEIDSEPEIADLEPNRAPWPSFRTAAMIAIVVGGVLVAVQQRERLLSLVYNLPKFERQAAIEQRNAPAQVSADPTPAPSSARPMPLRPTDYGVYATSNDALLELHVLPGRALDARVAVSAAFAAPSQTLLPNGHPKFIVFRRDLASNIADRANVRIIAKVAREFSAGAAGKKPSDEDAAWVIRNISFPFRASPVSDNPEMYELHSEDPLLVLTPGRYALVLKNQSYDFSVEGEPVDPRQCIERIVTSNGTFYSDCKKP